MRQEIRLAFRAARTADLDRIMEHIADGRRSLTRRGVDQWQDGYPDRAAVERDLCAGAGRVALVDGEVAAYAAFVFTGEPAYDGLRGGRWLTDGPYVAVHRLAVGDAFARRGVARALLRRAADEALRRGIAAFRIDTHPDNAYMRSLLASEGFACCGEVRYEAVRLAYEKRLVAPRYRYLLFDLDGTLTDPGAGITRSVQYALRHMGIEVPDPSVLTPFIGPPLRESFGAFYGLEGERADEAIRSMREYFAERGIFENDPYPGIHDTLARLGAAGHTLCVATSKPTLFAERILGHFALARYFRFVGGAEMDGRRQAKAEVIAHVMERCGIASASECLMIGDRRHDIAGAQAHGMDSCGVLWGYGSRAELTGAGATYVAASLDELERLLKTE